jgi:hypothetical protein
MQTTQIDFTRFCDHDISRYALAKPFLWGGKAVATDGRILVAVDPTMIPDAKAPDGKVPDISKVLDAHAGLTNWKPLPTWTKCELCEDKGFERTVCNDCGGSCYVECNYGHEHDCDSCDKGYVTERCDCHVDFDGTTIAKKYASAIAQFEDVEWCQSNYGKYKDAIAVRFTGGIGLIMPIEKRRT